MKGNFDGFDKAIADRFFSDSPEPLVRAKDVLLELNKNSGYGIVDSNFEFTDFGEKLYSLRHDPEKMYDRLAQHIRRELHGGKSRKLSKTSMQRARRQTTTLNRC